MKIYTTEQIIDHDLNFPFIKLEELISHLEEEQNRLLDLANKFLNFKPKDIQNIEDKSLKNIEAGITLTRGRLSLLEDMFRALKKSHTYFLKYNNGGVSK